MNELDQLLHDLAIASPQDPINERTLEEENDPGRYPAKIKTSSLIINDHDSNFSSPIDPTPFDTIEIKSGKFSSIANDDDYTPTPDSSRVQRDFESVAHKDLERLVQKGTRDILSSSERVTISKPYQLCSSCHQQINEIENSVTALGQVFHPEHFRCNRCSKQLAGAIFFEKENRPYCEKCMNENFLLPKCAYCGENIKGKCINALNKNWHPDHFFCSQCGRHFPPGAPFLEKDGKAYCEEDYFNMFAPKCATCDLPISDEVVTALGKSFHASCFVCSEPGCKILLSDAGCFFEYNAKPYCEIHYHSARGSLCASCLKPITGRCLTAIGKRFHPEHFVCAFCKKQLGSAGGSSQATFKDRDGKPYCLTCYVKLYG